MFHGIKIYAPTDISKLDYDFIDIWIKNGYEDIKTQTNAMGMSDKKIVSAFYHFTQKVINTYSNTSDAEIKSFLNIMEKQKNPCVYAYNPVKQDDIREAVYDERKGLYYVLFEEKRLYLAKNYDFTINNGKKYVSNLWQEQDINSLVKEPVNFIKMDIEGEEINALKGSDKVFAGSSNIKCSICSYHRHGDEEKLKRGIVRNKIRLSNNQFKSFVILNRRKQSDWCEARNTNCSSLGSWEKM